MIPSQAAATPMVARNAGRRVVAISCDQSLNSDASPTPTTVRFSHGRRRFWRSDTSVLCVNCDFRWTAMADRDLELAELHGSEHLEPWDCGNYAAVRVPKGGGPTP